MGRYSLSRGLLLGLLIFVLVSGFQAQTQDQADQLPEWARLNTGENPLIVNITQVDGSGGWDLAVVTQPANADFATVSGLYGMWDGRFWTHYLGGTPTAEVSGPTVELRIEGIEVGERTDKGTLGVSSNFNGNEPVQMMPLECPGVSNKLILNKGTPYIFRIKDDLTPFTVKPPDVTPDPLLNWKLFDVRQVPAGGVVNWARNPNILKFPSDATSFAIADFNHDMIPELVMASGEALKLYVMQGDGQCNFLTPAIEDENQTREKPREDGSQLKAIYGLLLSELADQPYALQEFSFPDGNTPNFVIAEDFNEDGTQDLAVAVGGVLGKSVSVFLNKGYGEFPLFDLESRYDAASDLKFLIARDFNKDLHLDLVAFGVSKFVFLRGTGKQQGSFERDWVDGITDNPRQAVAEDFNGDENLDLAIVNFGPTEKIPTGASWPAEGGVDIWRGTGDGKFMSAQSLLQGRKPTALAVQDLDGDGDLDLIVSLVTTNEIVVLLNQAGTFVPLMRPRVGLYGANAITATDFNGDGVDDLAIAYVNNLDENIDKQGKQLDPWKPGETGEAKVLLGGAKNGKPLDPDKKETPDGSFQLLQANDKRAFLTPTNVGVFPAVATGKYDLQKDGKQDLVVINSGENRLCILLGIQPSTDWNQPPCTNITLPFDVRPRTVGVADLDKDEHLDLAVATSNNRVYTYYGNGQGGFQQKGTQWYQVGKQPASIATGDFDSDGDSDLAIANFGSNDITILFNAGDGTFFTPGAIISVGTMPTSIVAHDFDEDNDIDLAVANFGSNDIHILFNKGDGTFEIAKVDVGRSPISVVVGYRNGHSLNPLVGEPDDPLPDLAVANFASSDITLLLGRKDDQGNFSFEPKLMKDIVQPIYNIMGYPCTACTENKTLPNGPVGIAAGFFRSQNQTTLDLAIAVEFPTDTLSAHVEDQSIQDALKNKLRDPRQDVFLIYNGTTDISSTEGGNGKPGPCPQPGAVAIGNFDGDGFQDLAVTCAASNPAVVLWGKGHGEFETAASLQAKTDTDQGMSTVQGVTAVTVGDFNGDQRQDLALANTSSNQVAMLLNQGDRKFSRTDVSVGVAPIALVTSDFDQDRNQDIAVANEGSGDISVLVGDGQGGFPEIKVTKARDSPKAIAAEDFNHDGFPDLAIVDLMRDAILVFLNKGQVGQAEFEPYQGGPNEYVREYNVKPHPRAVVAQDLDGDGDPDLAVITYNSTESSISVFFNNGNGDFSGFPKTVGEALIAIAAVDCNNDRLEDLAALDTTGGAVLLLVNQGNRAFSLGQTVYVEARPSALVAGDVDGDGKTDDLVVTNAGSNSVSILLGDGTCRFERKDITFEQGG